MPRQSKTRLTVLLATILILSTVFGGCGKTAPAVSVSVETTEAAEEIAPKLKKNLQTILIMGLDDYERPEESEGYLNDMQSDFILLAVIDTENHVFRGLHINRDTMARIPRIGVFGDNAGSYTAQLALAHTFGSGGSDSCLNAVKAVSRFLDNIQIDHYMTFTMDSVAMINDMVGGVTVTVLDDFGEYDKSLVKGEEVTLTGEQALHYVRGRGGVGDQTNISRMERQRQYMNGLYINAMKAAQADENFIKNLVLKLSDSFMTDCSISQLDALSKTMAECEMEPFITIPGESKVGKFMEFYADEAALKDIIQDLFYEPIA